ncbi:MAG: toprim domain-containing protein, partial [bacterium]|nr:toprim domain-containing protein [bacterium]
GFSGRIYDNSDLNKYQNTKETPIFKKRENLFNYHRAKDEIRKSKYVIVMEGFMAVIRAYSVGIKNCIATMGTALSTEQSALIKKLSNTIYLCYDGDDAGHKATITSGDEFTKLGCNVFVIPLSDKLDPDDYIIKYGDEAFKNLIDNAIPYKDYKIRILKKSYDLNNIDDKTNYINKVLLEIAKEKDPVKREIMLKNLANDTNVWYNTLEKKLLELDNSEKGLKKKEDFVVKKDKKDGYFKAMESLIYYALNYPCAITLIDNSNVYIPDKDIRIILNEIIAYYNKYGKISEADFYTYLDQSENKDLQVVLKKVLSNDYPTIVNDNQVNECLIAIKNYNIALEIKKLEKKIKEEVDITRQMELMDEILKLRTKEGKSW